MAKLDKLRKLEIKFIIDPRESVKRGAGDDNADEYYPAIQVITAIAKDDDGTMRNVFERKYLGSAQQSHYTWPDVKALLQGWNNMNSAVLSDIQAVYNEYVNEEF